MVVNYSKSKIYKIVGPDEKLIYIDATTVRLSSRLCQHIKIYETLKAKGKEGGSHIRYVFEKYGVDKCKILLIENYPCDSREELIARKAEIIKNHSNCCDHSYNVTTQSFDETKAKRKDAEWRIFCFTDLKEEWLPVVASTTHRLSRTLYNNKIAYKNYKKNPIEHKYRPVFQLFDKYGITGVKTVFLAWCPNFTYKDVQETIKTFTDSFDTLNT